MAYVAIYQLLISLFVGCNYWWPFAPLDKRYSSDVYLMQFGRIAGRQSLFESYLESLDFVHDTLIPMSWSIGRPVF